MCRKTSLKSIYLFCLILIISITKYLNHVDSCIKSQMFHLNIAILSAKGNFAKRQVIRDTWMKHITRLNEISVKNEWKFTINANFVLGSKSCEIHPHNRVDSYGCIPKLLRDDDLKTIFGNKSKLLFESTNFIDENINKVYFKSFHKGFSFQVNFQILNQSIKILFCRLIIQLLLRKLEFFQRCLTYLI